MLYIISFDLASTGGDLTSRQIDLKAGVDPLAVYLAFRPASDGKTGRRRALVGTR